MNSPYCGKFKVSQGFRPPSNPSHDGLDLVGVDSKEIHATVSGTVHFAGWENPGNHAQGFGQYVCVRGMDGLFYYYGHMSKLNVKTGDLVTCTDVIGIEGSTGRSTGSHCHYEIRKAFYKGAEVINVCNVSGIPNVAGGVYDDGYRPKVRKQADVKTIQKALNAHGYNCGQVDGVVGTKTVAALLKAVSDLWC